MHSLIRVNSKILEDSEVYSLIHGNQIHDNIENQENFVNLENFDIHEDSEIQDSTIQDHSPKM